MSDFSLARADTRSASRPARAEHRDLEPVETPDPRNDLLDGIVRLVELHVAADSQLGAALIARLQGLYPVKPQPAPAGPFGPLDLAAIFTALRIVGGRRLSEGDHQAVAHAKGLVMQAIRQGQGV